MKIVIDNKIPFIKGVLEPYAEVEYLNGKTICRKDIVDADAIIIRTRTKCNAELLEGTKVRFIASATIGFDHINTDYCRSRNIHWTNAEGCNSSSVQQYIASALFYLIEKFNLSLDSITVGIIGVGNIGTKVASLCESLGMKVLLNDPPRERLEGKSGFVSLNKIISGADIITIHVPLNIGGIDNTFHLVDNNFASKLKKNQFLINTSRGEVMEAYAIKSILRDKKIAGCVLDVWENEPEIDLELLNLVDIGTPHIAGYSVDGKANATAMSVNALSNFFRLGIDNWYPDRLPNVQNNILKIDCDGLNYQQIIGKLIKETYDIDKDYQRLRSSPNTFENQRGNYPIRREFGHFQVDFMNADKGIELIIAALGFKIGN